MHGVLKMQGEVSSSPCRHKNDAFSLHVFNGLERAEGCRIGTNAKYIFLKMQYKG